MSTIIGQSKLMNKLEALKSGFPSFTILEGPEGQGKKTLAPRIAEELGFRFITIGNKIDDIREMISGSVGLTKPTMYFIPNGDNMSMGARNSLLKITEEPPRNLYILMGLEHRENTLGTIRSRASVLELDNYARAELRQYIESKYPELDKEVAEEFLDYADNPGEVDHLITIGVEMLDYAYKVYDNILEVSTGNSFKIPQKFKFKEDDTGYPVSIFMKIFQRICLEKVHPEVYPNVTVDEIELATMMIRATSHALGQLTVRGISKKAVADLWILDLRRLR